MLPYQSTDTGSSFTSNPSYSYSVYGPSWGAGQNANLNYASNYDYSGVNTNGPNYGNVINVPANGNWTFYDLDESLLLIVIKTFQKLRRPEIYQILLTFPRLFNFVIICRLYLLLLQHFNFSRCYRWRSKIIFLNNSGCFGIITFLR